MKSLVFDTGPLISLTMNNLLWLIEPLKERFKGSFIIPQSVKAELVDDPLRTKRFKFEAIQILHYIENGVLTVVDDRKYKEQTLKLLNMANSCFSVRGRAITAVHYGEASAVAVAKALHADAIAIDERVTRELIEDPERIGKIMEHKLHTKIAINRGIIKDLKKELKGLNILRSFEMVTIAFELGLLKRYLVRGDEIPNVRKTLLESVLWGVKTDGCAVSEKEIRQVMKLERV
ncbi:hypothetical protein JXB11_00515 [Candidatus Woesearchaeota archaeon]|nr:hypothetical protein [Candidatus Woesearchaeota archaeon]